MSGNTLLAMKGISKAFPGVNALTDVSFDVKAGEVHALVGENGAGKSTLMKILGGVYLPDSGEIELDGEPVDIRDPRDALSRGISVIYQEFNLVPTLTVSENIFLGYELRTPLGLIDRPRMRSEAQRLITSFGFQMIDSSALVGELSIAQQQLVEILKALFHDSRLLVMDEPTAVLTDRESEALFAIIDNLSGRGVGIVYISHRLDEVVSLSDRVTVLRDGLHVIELDNSRRDVSKETIVKHMVGRELSAYYPEREPYQAAEPVLEVVGLSRRGMFEDVSFHLGRGEILGFFGLVGAGRTEVMKTVYGDYALDEGEIRLNGKAVRVRSPRDAIRRGIALVPEDRKAEGLVLIRSLSDNIALPNRDLVSRLGVLSRRLKAELATAQIRGTGIRPPVMSRLAEDFSGGNQQKIVLGKWLSAGPSIIIMDEPTRGIDVSAKLEIYGIMNDLTRRGISIIVVSSELLEVLGVCDRILVMHEGRIAGEFQSRQTTQEEIVGAASGI